MDKENLLSEQINRVPSDALNAPSKEQEQMLEIKILTKTYMAQTYPFQM